MEKFDMAVITSLSVKRFKNYIDVNSNNMTHKVLPPNLIIDYADTHLYRIGASLFKPEVAKRRTNNPFWIAIVGRIYLIKCIISVSLSDDNEHNKYLWIGEFFYFSKIKSNSTQ